jgi:plasmid replication initiation protein
MEHPVFSLSTRPDMRVLHYEHNGNSVTIKPSYDGLATIHDKDILLYCASYLRAAINQGYQPKQNIRLTAYNLLISTNRQTDGDSYERLKNSLNRLRGTTINTNIKTAGFEIEEGFGLIESWKIIKEDHNGRMVAIEIKLPDWIYNAIVANELLTINQDYFLLRKPLERRIYELARKHCGHDKEFKINLSKLHKKIGTTAPLFKFRASIREIIKTNRLPDYRVSMECDIVTFTSRRKPMNRPNAPLPLLESETFEKAKKIAPGFDIYALEREWREWIEGKEKPKTPDAAFVAFCRKKYQEQTRG